MSVLITEASYFRVGLGGRTHQSDQCTHEIVALQNRFLKSCSCVFLEFPQRLLRGTHGLNL